ncbi:hypothetical protein ACFU6I_28610 [Streptomyces sp. NPDC057486]|uniref:hypothetical protein n=1 Tax=Streptomyces sp. NPDC057486 TaxID=3346145 RepID=UPI003688258D
MTDAEWAEVRPLLRGHGLVKEFHDRLRGQVHERLGRDAEPTAGVIDSQSVKADAARSSAPASPKSFGSSRRT